MRKKSKSKSKRIIKDIFNESYSSSLKYISGEKEIKERERNGVHIEKLLMV